MDPISDAILPGLGEVVVEKLISRKEVKELRARLERIESKLNLQLAEPLRSATTFIELRLYEQARDALVRAESLDNSFPLIPYLLGLILYQLGDTPSALKRFQRVAQLNPYLLRELMPERRRIPTFSTRVENYLLNGQKPAQSLWSYRRRSRTLRVASTGNATAQEFEGASLFLEEQSTYGRKRIVGLQLSSGRVMVSVDISNGQRLVLASPEYVVVGPHPYKWLSELLDAGALGNFHLLSATNLKHQHTLSESEYRTGFALEGIVGTKSEKAGDGFYAKHYNVCTKGLSHSNFEAEAYYSDLWARYDPKQLVVANMTDPFGAHLYDITIGTRGPEGFIVTRVS